MVYIQKGEDGPYDRLLSEGPSLAAVEERSHNGLLLEGPYRPRCGQQIHRERLRTISRRSEQEFYKGFRVFDLDEFDARQLEQYEICPGALHFPRYAQSLEEAGIGQVFLFIIFANMKRFELCHFRTWSLLQAEMKPSASHSGRGRTLNICKLSRLCFRDSPLLTNF
jgi:hypothetical protein